MDDTTENTCLEEISTLVFDANEKVSVKTISNNWMVQFDVARAVLKKWVSQNEKKLTELDLEFLINGRNSKGKLTISVVSENTKKRLEEKWTDFTASLYSVETKSNSRSLNLPSKYEAIKVKKIIIDFVPRKITRPVAIKQEMKNVDTTKIKTPFGMVKPFDKKQEEKKPVEEKKSVEIKKDPSPVKVTEPAKVSPPTLKQSTTSATTSKKGAKAQSQKGNISSFFGKAPTASKTTQNEVKVQKEEIKKEPSVTKKEKSPPVKMEIDDGEKQTRKRSPSVEKPKAITKQKPPQKKMKLKEPKNKKRSRIQVMEDSSEDEDEKEKSEFEERDTKLIKFDREETPEPKGRSKSPTPERKLEAADQKTNGKNKAKRWVTKRFETDDGYIRTEKVLEEYSASEDENDENRKKNSPPKAKEVSSTTAVVKKSAEKKPTTSKAKPKDVVKTKQGSIMSFFSKK